MFDYIMQLLNHWLVEPVIIILGSLLMGWIAYKTIQLINGGR
jgi:hypothetical protein